jgi:hypothetical protein
LGLAVELLNVPEEIEPDDGAIAGGVGQIPPPFCTQVMEALLALLTV